MTQKNNKILVVIPARAGSKGIPRKNIRLMCGKPLISYSIINAVKSKYLIDVIVSTDDEEIERASTLYGAEIVHRPKELATDKVTLDPVVYHALNVMETRKNKLYDIVITMQPTSPLLKTESLDSAIKYFTENNFDTVLSGVNRPHLAWTKENDTVMPLYKERLNRQQLPINLLETGAFFISKREFIQENNRFGPNVSIYEVSDNESVDIDTAQDWWIAEKELSKKVIIIRTEGYAEIGLGHIYRCLLLAHNLIDHDIRFLISQKSDIGIKKIQESHFPYTVIQDNHDVSELIHKYKGDILINDILDTKEEYIKNCKELGIRVVNFEDLGKGAKHADAVINDLYYKNNDYKNHYWGSDFYCIRDEFLLARPTKFRKEVKEILVIFGGTDPCNLTKRLLEVVNLIPKKKDIHFTFIIGMGYGDENTIFEMTKDLDLNIEIIRDVKLMTEYMQKADIAISSQGRTMLELASMTVPTILISQNERESYHEFGGLKNGFINLGLGNDIDNQTIKETLIWMINSPQIRAQMKEQMLKADLKNGIKKVMNIMLNNEI